VYDFIRDLVRGCDFARGIRHQRDHSGEETIGTVEFRDRRETVTHKLDTIEGAINPH